MSISNLFEPNSYDINCNQITANTYVGLPATTIPVVDWTAGANLTFVTANIGPVTPQNVVYYDLGTHYVLTGAILVAGATVALVNRNIAATIELPIPINTGIFYIPGTGMMVGLSGTYAPPNEVINNMGRFLPNSATQLLYQGVLFATTTAATNQNHLFEFSVTLTKA